MISGWLSKTLARSNIHYGWAMVGVTFEWILKGPPTTTGAEAAQGTLGDSNA